jgi:hypothetical protein
MVCKNLYQKYHPDTIDDVWFYGGPPGKETWYNGTLYQYVIDRLMQGLNTSSAGAMIYKLKLGKKHASSSNS